MSIQKTEELLGLYEKQEVGIEEVSSLLGLSERQTYRLIKRYRQEGVLGLFHKGRDKPSNHKTSDEKKTAETQAISPEARPKKHVWGVIANRRQF